MVMYINFITTNGCIVSVVAINIVESLLIFIVLCTTHFVYHNTPKMLFVYF